MELMIGISLLFDIFDYYILATMFTNSTGEVSIRPEFSSPEFLLNLRTSLEDLPCGKALDRRYYLRHGVGWDRLHKKMYMILVRSNLQEFYLISIFDLYTHLFHHCINVLVEYDTSVFCGKNQMVYQYRNIMALMNVFAHITTLRRKRRGIQPQAI